jgi:hypothetical protein
MPLSAQEILIVAEKQKNELNEAQIIAFLQDIVNKIQTEEDPLKLNQFRRLFKKVVPFYLRSYFAAYLLKQINAGRAPRIQASSNQGGRGDRTDRNERGDRNDKAGRGEGRADRNDRSGRSDRPNRGEQGRGEQGERSERQKRGEGRKRDGEGRSAGEAKAEPRNVLPDDVSTTLFVSIGRNRRVYPRDLIGLIMQNVEIEREHVGDIRVLDNYSFVQVITEDAQKVIDALNEFEYRGRKLAVSFSRKKEEASDTAPMAGISAGNAENADDGAAYTDGGDNDDTADGFDADGGVDGNAGDTYDEDRSYDEVTTDGSDGIDKQTEGAGGNGSADAEPDDDEENNTNV